MKFTLLTPLKDPPNLAPGWYFAFEDRAGELRSAGPYASAEFCQRVIDNIEPCSMSDCGGISIIDNFEHPELEAAGLAAGGQVLCKECEAEFIRWHKQQYGKPPTPVGVQ